jgi:hypothetical protein
MLSVQGLSSFGGYSPFCLGHRAVWLVCYAGEDQQDVGRPPRGLLLNGKTYPACIKAFLSASTWPDLAERYDFGDEAQLNFAQGDGVVVPKSFEMKDGKTKDYKWYGNGIEEWPQKWRDPLPDGKPHQGRVKYDFAQHINAIGVSGRNHEHGLTLRFGIEWDAQTGHSEKFKKGLTPDQLEEVRQKLWPIPWLEIRKSTSGKALHVWGELAEPIPTADRAEHAAIARAMLKVMSDLANYDFSNCDACGRIMWLWGRKMIGTQGLKRLKPAEVSIPPDLVPANWRDYLIQPKGAKPAHARGYSPELEEFYKAVGSTYPQVPRDDQHEALITCLAKIGASHSWDQDRWLLQVCAADLKRAHQALGLRGYFDTLSQGTEPNTFLSPRPNGAWLAVRHGPRTQEHSSWDHSDQWTKVDFNVALTFDGACRAKQATELENGWQLDAVADAKWVVEQTCTTSLPDLPERAVILKRSKQKGKLVAEVERHGRETYRGWAAPSPTARKLTCLLTLKEEPAESSRDDAIRFIVDAKQKELGWLRKDKAGKWNTLSKSTMQDTLVSEGMSKTAASGIMGAIALDPWKIGSRHFQPEWNEKDRIWNYSGAKHREPTPGDGPFTFPTHEKVLQHCGMNLDDAVAADPWCEKHGIKTGRDYLFVWIASLFQFP